MRVVIGWIVAGTLLAFSVLVAVSTWNTRETATWVVISVGVAGGLGAALRSVESATPPGGKGLLRGILRPVLSLSAGAATFLGAFAAECHDVAGVPSWERCQSWFGNPTVDWPGAPLLALALGLGVGYLVWRLFGKVFPSREDQSTR